MQLVRFPGPRPAAGAWPPGTGLFPPPEGGRPAAGGTAPQPPYITGELWFNNVPLEDPRRDVGVAQLDAVQGNFADVFDFNTSLSTRDAAFLGLRQRTRSGSDTYSFNTGLKVPDVAHLLPTLGFTIPVSYTLARDVSRPKFFTSSDTENDAARAEEQRNENVRRGFGFSVQKKPSKSDGDWESPSVTDVLYVSARNADVVREAFRATPLIAVVDRVRHNLNRNTRAGSRRNITAHYDLGNAFYEKWLDRTMTYSSARFESGANDLSSAHTNKYASLAKTIGLSHGESVLEIGSGWGGFAEFAAKEIGAKVTGLTISPSQLDYARERIFREGLSDRVEFRLLDYRDASGSFDKIASIEMFEACLRVF